MLMFILRHPLPFRSFSSSQPANVLLNEDCSLKICDFGLSRVVTQEPSTDPVPPPASVVTSTQSGKVRPLFADSPVLRLFVRAECFFLLLPAAAPPQHAEGCNVGGVNDSLMKAWAWCFVYRAVVSQRLKLSLAGFALGTPVDRACGTCDRYACAALSCLVLSCLVLCRCRSRRCSPLGCFPAEISFVFVPRERKRPQLFLSPRDPRPSLVLTPRNAARLLADEATRRGRGSSGFRQPSNVSRGGGGRGRISGCG